MSVWHRPLVWVTRNIREALKGANAPSSENPFATIDDVGGGGGSPSGIQYVDVQLDNAQLLNLKASPVELIPSPGNGYMLDLHKIIGIFDNTGGLYTVNSGSPLLGMEINGELAFNNVQIGGDGWNSGNGYPALTTYQGVFALGRMLINGNTFYTYSDGVDPTFLDDQALLLNNRGDVEWGGGHADNTLSLRIWYSTVPTVPFGDA